MGDVFTEHIPQRLLTEQDHLIETFRLDGSNESLGVCIQVGRSCGELDGLDSGGAEYGVEGSRELRVPVVNQVSSVVQLSVPACDVSGYLLHPRLVWVWCEPAEMHSPGREVDEEQDKEADETVLRDHFDREEVRSHDALSVGSDELRPGELGSTTTSRG